MGRVRVQNDGQGFFPFSSGHTFHHSPLRPAIKPLAVRPKKTNLAPLRNTIPDTHALQCAARAPLNVAICIRIPAENARCVLSLYQSTGSAI